MGVYIKNLEMPKKCESCPFFEAVSCEEDSKDYRCARTGLYVFPKEKSIHCPLVEVKPHGRLIDADALLQHQWVSSDWNCGGVHEIVVSITDIDDAPTIIESEGET